MFLEFWGLKSKNTLYLFSSTPQIKGKEMNKNPNMYP